uniref:BLUF domain-containing protein n=1 Tax=Cyprinus carpio TaxID=7962 RepID=A0A8C1U3A1_CYPCA
MERDTQSSSTAADHENGSSLFHRRLTHRRELKFLLHRLTVIGRLSCGAADRRTVGGLSERLRFLIKGFRVSLQSRPRPEKFSFKITSGVCCVLDHYERLILSLQRIRAGEDVTGLLLLYPQHVLLVIECSTEALLSVLQDLRHMEENSGPILEPRILLVSHDLPSRLFQLWSYKLLDETDSQRTLVSDEQSLERLVRDTLHQILRLGRHLLNKTQQITGSKVIPDGVLKEASDAVPPQAAVSRLLQMEALLSPARYISTYHSPLHHRLDSGHVFGSFRPTTV